MKPTKKTKEISICRNCYKPVVWTFAFDGAEYYCLLCGNMTGMLGGKIDVESTPELRAYKVLIERVFKTIRKNLIGTGRFSRQDCKKCKTDMYHGSHLTKSEKEKDKVSKHFLDLLSGKNESL